MHSHSNGLLGIAILLFLSLAFNIGFLIWAWWTSRKHPRGAKINRCFAGDVRAMTLTSADAQGADADQPVETDKSTRRRSRDLGVEIGSLAPGKFNAITDVPGVKVGHTTVFHGEGDLVRGEGPARTGVTVIMPHSGDIWRDKVTAASFVVNGNGGMLGLDWIRESGGIEGPIALTNTHQVGDVASAMVRWMISKYPDIGVDDETYVPVVGECDDSALNDAQGFHVKQQHVFAALDGAASGAVAEGAVGAGTGMSCYDWKGGIGTSSRVLSEDDGGYTVGVLVNCNHGDRDQMRIDGVPVGVHLEQDMATVHREGSIVIVVATDAPLNARQVERLCKRAAMGLARTGSVANTSSGDFIVGFSTGRKIPRASEDTVLSLPELSDNAIDPLYAATADATEEAIINALCMADTVVGRDGNTSTAMPLDRVVELMRTYGRIKN